MVAGHALLGGVEAFHEPLSNFEVYGRYARAAWRFSMNPDLEFGPRTFLSAATNNKNCRSPQTARGACVPIGLGWLLHIAADRNVRGPDARTMRVHGSNSCGFPNGGFS
jgi:hypothetical protein